MYRKTLAGLFSLVSLAACTPGRQPVAPAPAPSAPELPPPAAVDTVVPVGGELVLRGAPASVGADLLGTAQYDLPVVANEWVRMELEFLVYQRHEVVAGWLRQADRYDEWVRDVFASYGIPRDLHHLGMVESGYRPTVRSHAGAVGMWQFMPATGRQMGLRIDTLVDERMDPVRATHAAARHLRDLHRRFRGDWALAAAAYNAGEGRINRGLGRFGVNNFWDLAQRGDLAQETRRYVPRLFAVTIIAKDPARFGYPVPGMSRRFAYDSVRVDLQTPLSVLAQAGNLPLSELTELNPHMVRQTAPRNYWVWVPLGQGAALQQAFQSSEYRQRGGYAYYRVREGESLSRLAELSGVPAERIRGMNLSANLENLRAGDRIRLYADAARVLDARPVERTAARRGPRVLGDPVSGAETAPSGDRGEPRSSSRRDEASHAGGSASSPRRDEGSSSSSARRSEGAASSSPARRSEGSSSSSSVRRSEGSASSSTRRSEGSSSSASTARRPGAADASSARPSSSSSSPSSASGARRGEAAGPGRTHTVDDGETLWGIARRYDVTVDAVRQANDLDEGDPIQPGQTLRIPRASGSPASAAGGSRGESASRTTPPGAERRSPPAETGSGSRSGSAERRASSTEAASGSRSGSASTERRPSSSGAASGERRGGSAPSQARPSSSGTRPASGGGPARREHTVGEGETLWGIARRYETTVDSLRRANDLDEDQQIRPGQKLRIPED